jgi:protein-S-isoprenylcysteine O-methyltransferase Ste14
VTHSLLDEADATTPPEAAPSTRRRLDVSWMLTTALLAGLSLTFAIVHLRHWQETGRASGLAFAAMELVLVGVFVARRRPLLTSRRPADWVVALVGGYGPLLFRPADAAVFGGGWWWTAGEALGTLLAVVCIVRLGRSFGIIAANRGIQVAGPYRLVRHPIYACYLVGQIFYLLGNPSLLNVGVWVIAISGQLLRIRAEEHLLSGDPAYRSYQQRVRFRLIPGLY